MRKRDMLYKNNFLLNVFNPEGNDEPNIDGVYADKIWIENDRLYLRVIEKPNYTKLKYFTKEDKFGENYYSIECDLSKYSKHSRIMIEVESRFSFIDGHDVLKNESNIQNNLKKKAKKKEERAEKTVAFKGAQIPQFEAINLRKLELERNEKEFLVKCLEIHKKNVTSIDINLKGNRIISGSRDKTIKISDFNGNIIRSLSDEPQEIKEVIFHQKKNRETIICVAYNDFNPKIYIAKWDINTGNLIKKFTIEGDTEWRSASIDICLEKKLIVFANSKGEIPIKLYDLKNGRLIKTFEKQTPFTIPASKLFSGKAMTGYKTFNTISISPNGKYVISGHSGQGDNIQLWDVKSGIVIKQFPETGWVNILRFSQSGEIVISGKLDAIKLWNLSTQQLIGELEVNLFDKPQIVFSPDNKFIACGEIAGKIKIWEFKTKKLISEFQAHTDAVTSLRFSSDGKILISSGSRTDPTMKIWKNFWN